MKYRYEIELHGDLGDGSMITLKCDYELQLSEDKTALVTEYGDIVFDANGETIITFECFAND